MKYLFSNIITSISRALYGFCVRTHLRYLSHLILLLNTRVYGDRNSKIRILCVSKSIFYDDVRALAKYGRRICYFYIPSYYFRDLFSFFFPGGTVTHENYHHVKGMEENKQAYRNSIKSILIFFKNTYFINGLLTANFTYYYLQEVFNASKEVEIKSFVLYKEGLAPREILKEYLNLYKPYKNLADYILFYNEPNRKVMIKVPVNGISLDNSISAGIPRLDVYHNSQLRISKQVVLFSFYPQDKAVGMFNNDKNTEVFYKRVRSFHKYVIEFAVNHPEFKVIIKTKPAEKYLNYAVSICEECLGRKKPDNLVITSKGRSFDYIQNASAVLGYNSTTLVEAIIANKNIVLPYFKDLTNKKPSDYFYKFPDFPNYAKSYSELEGSLINSNLRKYNPEHKEKFLSGMLYRNDGCASERVEEFIISKISQQ